MAGDWSDEQNDAIVADYFAMLGDDIAGRPYARQADVPQATSSISDNPSSSYLASRHSGMWRSRSA